MKLSNIYKLFASFQMSQYNISATLTNKYLHINISTVLSLYNLYCQANYLQVFTWASIIYPQQYISIYIIDKQIYKLKEKQMCNEQLNIRYIQSVCVVWDVWWQSFQASVWTVSNLEVARTYVKCIRIYSKISNRM